MVDDLGKSVCSRMSHQVEPQLDPIRLIKLLELSIIQLCPIVCNEDSQHLKAGDDIFSYESIDLLLGDQH